MFSDSHAKQKCIEHTRDLQGQSFKFYIDIVIFNTLYTYYIIVFMATIQNSIFTYCIWEHYETSHCYCEVSVDPVATKSSLTGLRLELGREAEAKAAEAKGLTASGGFVYKAAGFRPATELPVISQLRGW